ncbi:calcium-binding protein [Shimia biformata]|uniref:calcium-binding protein n=1 Tax=Shimia biformata TaxID=1294299 RepID=UPI0019524D58|nr:calcium-binding protein [Shimia biformata]
MPSYTIVDNNNYSTEQIGIEMFGANFVTTYDYEFSEDDNLNEVLEALGVSTFRFPGGGVTEGEFAEASFLTGNWSAESMEWNGEARTLTPLADFFATAGQVNADVQLVIPTRIAFLKSAGQALAEGNYGGRNELDPQYFDLLRDFVDQALEEAEANGIEVTRFEIGNEFWLGGEMSAAEYGFVAAEIANFLDHEYPGVEIIVQVVARTGTFSPVEAREVFLEPDGSGDFIIHQASSFDGVPPSDWIVATMPPNGNTITQTRSIADAILANPPASNVIDGVVEHVYFDGGFDGVDGQRDFALASIFDHFCSRIGRTNLDYFVTEWSPRNPRHTDGADNLGNANGLQYAHMTVEVFFELVSNGIDGANFWPMTFANPNTESRTLIDSVDGELTFGGVAFAWLSRATVGMSAIADFEVQGELSVHAFGDDDGVAIFVGDRDGEANTGSNEITLNLEGLGVSNFYFVTISGLTSENGVHDENSANAVVANSGGYMANGDLSFELGAWELALVDIQLVSNEDDQLHGSNLNDVIRGMGGNDWINGLGGDDSIEGKQGNDTLRGSEGDDTLKGGWGEDILYGGTGNDCLEGSHGQDELHGGIGNDVLRGDDGNDVLLGGDGNDTIYSGEGSDHVLGGDGSDLIFVRTSEVAELGWSGLNVNGNGQVGTMRYVSIDGMNRYSDVVDGGSGIDTLVLSDQNDAYFLQDDFADMPDGVDTELSPWGNESPARFRNIEIIDARGGNDLVDMTSHMFVSGGVTVLGGNGNDTIWGSASSERLEGEAGDDIIFGGAGADTLVGGSGADVFEFTSTSSQSRLEDFSISEGDSLIFYSQPTVLFDALTLRLHGQNLQIDFSSDFEDGVTNTLSIELSVESLASIQSVGLSALDFEILA